MQSAWVERAKAKAKASSAKAKARANAITPQEKEEIYGSRHVRVTIDIRRAALFGSAQSQSARVHR